MGENEKNQNIAEKNNSKKAGIRTLVSDVQELTRKKGFSLASLVGGREKKDITFEKKSFFVKFRPWVYVVAAILGTAILVLGVFWIALTRQENSLKTPTMPPPLIAASQERPIVLEVALEVAEESKFFLDQWQKNFTLQLSPRGFLNAPVFSPKSGTFLRAAEFFNLAGTNLPAFLENAFGSRASFGFIDTPRGNETLFIIEITNYSSAFAGLLEWERDLPLDIAVLLNPQFSYDTGGNAFRDTVVTNNDARFLQNRSGEDVLGYSIFNRKFLIIAQSSPVMELVIRKLSALPPQ